MKCLFTWLLFVLKMSVNNYAIPLGFRGKPEDGGSILHQNLVFYLLIFRWKCFFRFLCPVRRPVTALDCILLKDRSLALTPRQGPEISSWACLWVSPRPHHCIVVLLTNIQIFYILIPNFTMSLTYVFVNNGVKHKKSWGILT